MEGGGIWQGRCLVLWSPWSSDLHGEGDELAEAMSAAAAIELVLVGW